MSTSIQAVTVYCSSSNALDPIFHESARALGTELARRGITLVHGGGKVGLMGEIGRAMRAGGGRIIGVITEHLLDREQGDRDIEELIVVPTMRERKKLLEERGDAFIVLPGGAGTYEEFFEILVGRQLQHHNKPIGIVNVDGYFDPMMTMIEHGIERRFMRPAMRELFHIDPDPILTLDHLLLTPAVEVDDERFLPMGAHDGESTAHPG